MIDLESRLPPQSQEAEECVLGSMIRENDCFLEVCDIIDAEDFYFTCNAMLFKIIESSLRNGKPIDLVLLFEKLKDAGKLDEIGGSVGLAKLWDIAPTAANAVYYASIIREKSMLRATIRTCTEGVRDAYDHALPAEEILERTQAAVMAINAKREKSSIMKIGQAVDVVYREIEERAKPDAKAGSFIPTPFLSLNGFLGGFRKGHLITIAARPSIGKSAFAQNLVVPMAIEGIPVRVFSMEMKATEWTSRVLANEAEINLDAITGTTRFDFLNDSSRFAAACSRIRDIPLWIDENPDQSVESITARLRRAVMKDDVKLAVVDYLGLMKHAGRRSDNAAYEIGRTTRGLKELAMSLDIPIIMICQLNRAAESRENSQPALHDLRDSGSIEQDSNEVIFLYRAMKGSERHAVEEIKAYIAKQRNGPTGEVTLKYKRSHIKFTEPTI